jgi:preprotein translocase subunit SecG
MDILLTVVLVVHVLVALGIIGLVLLQHGKGAEMGAGFGAGASGSLFGASGSANFLSRTTAILAAIFFVTSLGLAFLAVQKPRASGGVMDGVKDAAPADSGAAALPGTAPAGSSANGVPVPSVPVPAVPATPGAGKASPENSPAGDSRK